MQCPFYALISSFKFFFWYRFQANLLQFYLRHYSRWKHFSGVSLFVEMVWMDPGTKLNQSIVRKVLVSFSVSVVLGFSIEVYSFHAQIENITDGGLTHITDGFVRWARRTDSHKILVSTTSNKNRYFLHCRTPPSINSYIPVIYPVTVIGTEIFSRQILVSLFIFFQSCSISV